MQLTLPESSRPASRKLGGTTLSAAIHAFVIGGTVIATGWTAEPTPRVPDPPKDILYVKPTVDPPPMPRTTGASRGHQREVLDRTVIREMTIDLSTIAPGIPPIDVALGDPRREEFTRGAVTSPSAATEGAGDATNDAPMSALAVERAVLPLPGQSPRYPDLLRQAGVEGDVEMQFVVDTLGRVERPSIRPLNATNTQFEHAVREALARMRFVPAEGGGRKVRQLVQQTFTFRLDAR